MKKMNKKGFTIVELVIVIAVIAILAAVLIPTFSGIVEKAQKSAALQEARNLYTEIYAEDISDGAADGKQADGTTDVSTSVAGYTGTVTKYDPDATSGNKFEYTASNDKDVTFDGTDWEVAE